MYKMPLDPLEKGRFVTAEFKGYENNCVIDENAFSFEENLTSDNYPVLSPRNKRAYFNVNGNKLHGLFSKDKICYINNNTLYYGGEAITGPVFPDIEGERTFVSMGARLLVFPDKYYVNTADFTDFGYLEAKFSGEYALCSLCRGDGDLYDGYSVGAAFTGTPSNGDLWVDTSSVPNILKQYSSETETWVEIEDKFIRITSNGIGEAFNVYDGVLIKGLEDTGISGTAIIYDKGEDYIVVPGMLSQNIEISDPFKVERKLPDMDFVCESSNRLWGCNSKKNEIYASKAGDPCNFNTYMGISTDSYAVTVGSDGEFTGVIPYRGYILFFKENCVHKVYGQNPPYTVTTSYIRGVQKGSHKSLCLLNESLYYKSPAGVCVFDGGVPIDVSHHLGNEYYTSAVGGAFLNKYYICMTDKDGKHTLFCYDQRLNIWHREGEADIREFCNNNQNLYFTENYNNTHRLGIIDSVKVFGNFTGDLKGYGIEGDFKWCAESGLWGLSLPQNKYYSNLLIRAIGEKGASLKVYFQFNSDGRWREQAVKKVVSTGSFSLSFITPRCDHLRIRLEGTGNMKILSISRDIEIGSDLNV